MNAPATAPHVAIIGTGIVGACTAMALLDRGFRVTLIDPGTPGGEQAASYGNGAFLSPNSIVPMSMPGLWRKVPGYLLDPAGPLTIRWTSLPRLAPWLLRFVAAGFTEARVRRTAAILRGLLADTVGQYQALAERVGAAHLIRPGGLLYVFPARKDFEAEALAWQLRHDNGLRWQELDRAALAAREPGLSPAYTFGVLVEEGGLCASPGGLVAALVDHAWGRGAALVAARARGLRLDGDRLLGVETDTGFIACDRAVIAAGIASAALARTVGDRIPMEAERGYHVQLDLPAPDGGPRGAVMPSDGKMANAWLDAGLRASGQVELATPGARPDWNRADILLRHLRATWPGLPPDAPVRRWQGNRPSTPDGLPVIDRSRWSGNVIHAFGHGHVGLSAGPMTAAIVAALLTGTAPPIDPIPFTARRF